VTCTVGDGLEGKWRTLPDILGDYKVLRPLVTHEMLRTICSHQDIDDEMLYRLDEARLLAWLRLKAKKKAANASLKSKQLQKVDKKGMKTLACFFSKK
jgi:hypothetical protein